ncbi:MAG: hypothetical protein J6P45_06150 [Lachnospiraceae bacterium]|nr:hypothetical protein [Lachnospiraceae bacterium]
MLISLEETVKLIKSGSILHIAGDNSLLEKLPKGNWIGGTTPYFITDEGGVMTKDKLFVTELDFAEEMRTASYGKYNVFQIVEECFENGLTLLIMPYGSKVVEKYAKESPEVEELLMHPTVGWIAGAELGTDDEIRVYDGVSGESYNDRAVVMYLRLPDNKTALVNMINIFQDDKTDPVITFSDNELSVTKCRVNGQEVNFAEYIKRKKIDTRMPLVADYNGSYINTSIKTAGEDTIDLYAPVFKGVEYRFARPVDDYVTEFAERIGSLRADAPVVSFNCILNYLYGGLEGRKIDTYCGPVSFGEVAYQLINQTLVYFEIS